MSEFSVRRFEPHDAPGVVELVHAAWGGGYAHQVMTDADALIAANRDGRLMSLVALDTSNQVVGHYALERLYPGMAIPETGAAMVHPRCQGHGLMNVLRDALEREAVTLGYPAIFGTPVLTHARSQRAYLRSNNLATGALLSYYGMNPNAPRVSAMVYFQYLRPPSPVCVYVPTRQQEWITTMYRDLNGSAEMGSPLAPANVTECSTETLDEPLLKVTRAGIDFENVLKKLLTVDAPTHVVELNLRDPSTAFAWDTAERVGFVYSAIVPLLYDGMDVLKLQRLSRDIGWNALDVEGERANKILAHIMSERKRVNAS